jgi:hypothetical protein
MRRLLNALPIAMAAMPAAAELPPDAWFSPCDAPVATCVRPLEAHANRVSCDGCSSQPTSSTGPRRLYPVADPTGEILDRWEAASQSFYPMTDAERLRLGTERPELTGQQIELVCALKQPVRADDLTRRYRWATLSKHGETATLVATPQDRLERLFYEQFVVDVDTSTGCPSGVRFGLAILSDKVASQTVALRPWVDPSRLDIELAGFESSEDERQPVRTADASDDATVRLPTKQRTNSLPPAPTQFDCDEP